MGSPSGLSRGPLRTLFDAGTNAGLTDGQLLERFATRRDGEAELAFSALVGRHGPMVLRACRGILRDDHEAMDAFQATFLVLARKGGSLWVRDSVGPWLHRVACRAAGRARSAAARRRAVETRAAEAAASRGAGGDDPRELAWLIHEEVDRLPERYRSPVVLCDLEGRTFEEAARHLGCPVGTVGSRLARGRQRLRDRLSRRGLAPGAGAGLFAGAARRPDPGAHASASLSAATAGAAVRYVSTRGAARGAAATLAQEVIRAMTTTRWWNAASVLFVLGASATGVVSLALAGGGDAVGEARPDDAPEKAPRAGADAAGAVEVKRGKFRVVIQERGNLEAARSTDVYSMVEGQTTILSILPEGTRVKKGQLVCTLDSASLKDRLTNQVISVRAAEAAHLNAGINREVAEIALKEYLEGVYPNDQAAVQAEIAMAKSSMTKAEERLKRTRNVRERVNGMVATTPADVLAGLDVEDRLEAAEEALLRGRGALEAGQNKQRVLEKFTKDRTVKQLRIEVEKARSAELAKEATSMLEKSKEAKLQRQIAGCTIPAPGDGVVVYANNPSRPGGIPTPQIEEGATVRERQKLFSLPDVDGPMRVAAKVHEAIVDQVTPGQTAVVKVDAFPGETFAAVVEAVAPLPDQYVFNSGVKVYTTRLLLTKGFPGLRPGMTAAVEILVAAVDDAITVPVGSIVSYDHKDHVAVKTPGGGIDWRDVTLGRSDGKAVVVKEGLKEGEAVALDPGSLMSEDQKRKVASSATRPGRSRAAAGKRPLISPELRDKVRAIPPEDRVRLRSARPEDRAAIFKKAGLTDDEIRQYNQLLDQTPGAPR